MFFFASRLQHAAAPAETKQYTKSFISCCSSVGAWCRLGNRRFLGTVENLHYSVSPSAITQPSLNQKKRNKDVQTIKNKRKEEGETGFRRQDAIHLHGNQSIHQSIHPAAISTPMISQVERLISKELCFTGRVPEEINEGMEEKGPSNVEQNVNYSGLWGWVSLKMSK